MQYKMIEIGHKLLAVEIDLVNLQSFVQDPLEAS